MLWRRLRLWGCTAAAGDDKAEYRMDGSFLSLLCVIRLEVGTWVAPFRRRRCLRRSVGGRSLCRRCFDDRWGGTPGEQDHSAHLGAPPALFGRAGPLVGGTAPSTVSGARLRGSGAVGRRLAGQTPGYKFRGSRRPGRLVALRDLAAGAAASPEETSPVGINR